MCDSMLIQSCEQQADRGFGISVWGCGGGTGNRWLGGTALGFAMASLRFERQSSLVQRVLLFFELLLAAEEFGLAVSQVFGKLGGLGRHQSIGHVFARQVVRIVVRFGGRSLDESVAEHSFVMERIDRMKARLGVRRVEATNDPAPLGGFQRTGIGRPVGAWLIARHGA
jgi:hypothetical protein